MSWNPKTWVANVLVTASDLNTEIRDRMLALLGPFMIYVDGPSVHPHLSAPCGGSVDNTGGSVTVLVSGPTFSGSADQYGMFQLAFPKSWNIGTITYRVRWTSQNAGSGAVVWALAGVALSDGNAMTTALGTAVNVTDTFQSVNVIHTSPTSTAVTIGNTPAKEDMIYFTIARLATNGSDTKAESVQLLGLELFITLDDVKDT